MWLSSLEFYFDESHSDASKSHGPEEQQTHTPRQGTNWSANGLRVGSRLNILVVIGHTRRFDLCVGNKPPMSVCKNDTLAWNKVSFIVIFLESFL